MTEWRWKDSTAWLSQQPGEAEGSLNRGMPGRVESSPDNGETGQNYQMAWAPLARREGAREKPVLKLRKARAGSNLVDMGRCAARGHRIGWSTPKPVDSAGGEATLKVCGVGVAMLPGHELGASLVDRSRGERGNRPRSLLASVGQAEAGGRSVAD